MSDCSGPSAKDEHYQARLGTAVDWKAMAALSTSHRRIILDLARKHGASDVRLFGSRGRGTGGATSDLDLLVRFGPSATLVTVIGFQQELQAALGLRVDVVEEGGLSPYLARRIMSEAVAL